jgi:hypothetical protein
LRIFGLYRRSAARIILKSVFAPTGELLSFASPKESNQRKGDPLPLDPALRLFSRGLSKGASLPLRQLAASMPPPCGQFPTKQTVLGAAEGIFRLRRSRYRIDFYRDIQKLLNTC